MKKYLFSQHLVLCEKLNKFEEGSIDEATLWQDPIAKKFWHSHNKELNQAQDSRTQGFNPLYPLRTLYKKYLLNTLTAGNAAITR